MVKALEDQQAILAASDLWRTAFQKGGEHIGTVKGQDVLWHETLGIWGVFATTQGSRGGARDWNVFGQRPIAFRENIIVEINPPRQGDSKRLQGVFALDPNGKRWVLHQGQMSIRGARITPADFVAATRMEPVQVQFRSGVQRAYYKVACLEDEPVIIQRSVAYFVAQCAIARVAKSAPNELVNRLREVADWEHGLRPEGTASYAKGAQAASEVHRQHGKVWRALVAELEGRGVRCSNDRVGQYGPDLFTFGSGRKLLFEIKCRVGAQDVFTAVGQLQVYEQLLRPIYRKVLVIPQGMGKTLDASLPLLGIGTLHYQLENGAIAFDPAQLDFYLRPA